MWDDKIDENCKKCQGTKQKDQMKFYAFLSTSFIISKCYKALSNSVTLSVIAEKKLLFEKKRRHIHVS